MDTNLKSELEKLIDEGYTQKKIAEKYDVGRTTIQRWLKKYDLKTTTSRTKGILDEHSKPELENLVNQGLSLNDMCKKYGISDDSVRYWLNKFDLKTKNKSFEDGNHKIAGSTYDYTLTERKCSKCKTTKSINEFYKRSDRKGQVQSICKTCNNSFRKPIKSLAVKYKGNKCEICDNTYCYASFDFHHKNPKEKDFSLSSSSSKRYCSSLDKIKDELDKCHLLCVNCHRETHYGLHPDFILIKNKEQIDEEEIEEEIKGETKECKTCRKKRSINDFYESSGCYWCKTCRRHQKRNDKRKDKRDAIEYKGGKCEHCGYDRCDAAMEFHHTNPKEKDFQISNTGKRFGYAVKKELDKCLLLCGNCHRKEHHLLIKRYDLL